jgi:hypothetical protein
MLFNVPTTKVIKTARLYQKDFTNGLLTVSISRWPNKQYLKSIVKAKF